MDSKNHINWVVRKSPSIHKIDEKDRKILALLATDSRLSLKQISQILKISKVAVFKRIKNLESKEIISGYSCFIDFQKIGFDIYNLGIKVNMTLEEKQEYLVRIQKIPFLSQILVLSSGKWDFLIRFFSRRGKVLDILSQFQDSRIENLDIIQANNFYFENRIFESIIKSNPKSIHLDKKNISILFELAKNSNQSIMELAEKIKFSPKQIIERIKKLKQEQIILLLSAYTNPSLYGDLGFILAVELKNRKQEEKIIEALVKIKNSTGGMLNLQNPNILTIHVINDLKDINKIEDVLSSYRDYVKSWSFIKIDEQIYYNFFPGAVYKELINCSPN